MSTTEENLPAVLTEKEAEKLVTEGRARFECLGCDQKQFLYLDGEAYIRWQVSTSYLKVDKAQKMYNQRANS